MTALHGPHVVDEPPCTQNILVAFFPPNCWICSVAPYFSPTAVTFWVSTVIMISETAIAKAIIVPGTGWSSVVRMGVLNIPVLTRKTVYCGREISLVLNALMIIIKLYMIGWSP